MLNIVLVEPEITGNTGTISRTCAVVGYLIFGKESAGLPEYLVYGHPEEAVRIPMRDTLRSLNLSNSVAIAVYEALRQLDYPALH